MKHDYRYIYFTNDLRAHIFICPHAADKADCRFVVHWVLSKALEGYFQVCFSPSLSMPLSLWASVRLSIHFLSVGLVGPLKDVREHFLYK